MQRILECKQYFFDIQIEYFELYFFTNMKNSQVMNINLCVKRFI